MNYCKISTNLKDVLGLVDEVGALAASEAEDFAAFEDAAASFLRR